jgi:hypothetical protein
MYKDVPAPTVITRSHGVEEHAVPLQIERYVSPTLDNLDRAPMRICMEPMCQTLDLRIGTEISC